MVTKVIGKVDGKEVVFERAEGDLWNTTVPLDLDGMYVVEVTAYDDAENVAFCTKILLIVDPTTLCAQRLIILPKSFRKNMMPSCKMMIFK